MKSLFYSILLLNLLAGSSQGSEELTFKDQLRQSSKEIRTHLENSQKDLELRYQDNFLNSPDYENRLQAAIYLGVFYKNKNPELSQKYMNAAKSMRDPFSISEFDNLIHVYEAESNQHQGFNAKTTEILEALVKESKNLPWRMEKSSFESILDYYLSLEDHQKYMTTFNNYYAALPNFLLEGRYLKQAAEILKFSKDRNKPNYHRVLEIMGSWYPLNEDAIWALKKLDEHSKEGRYHFKLSYLRKLYLNGSIESQPQDLILGLLRGPVRPKKRMSPRILDNLELVKFFVRIREYDEASILAYDTNLNGSVQGQWLASQWLAFINGRQGNHDEAVAMYEDNILENDGEQSLFFQENYAENLMKNRRHVRAASTFLNAYKTKKHHRIRWYAFWNSYKAKMDSDALNIISESRKIFTRSSHNKYAEDYWMGKVQMRQGDSISGLRNFKRILSEDKYGYYSTMIKLQYEGIEGVPHGDIVSNSLEPTDFSREMSQPEIMALNWGVDAEELLEGGEDNLEEVPVPASSGFPFSLASSSVPPSIAEELKMKRRYPRILSEKVEFIASKYDLDPNILYALMRAESSFNPLAVSNVGARGIMQMMPYTAVRLSKLIDDEGFSLDELNDPGHAIYYGSAYFKLLLEAYDQNLVVAIAAYNAGPKAVNNWLASCRHCNIDDFVELIPFKETRLYVKKVVKNYAAYKDLYDNEEVFSKIPSLPKEPKSDLITF